jgi:hypothetical protein
MSLVVHQPPPPPSRNPSLRRVPTTDSFFTSTKHQSNFHQFVVFETLTNETASNRRRNLLLVLSFLLVVTQYAVLMAVGDGTWKSTCLTNRDCDEDRWCSVSTGACQLREYEEDCFQGNRTALVEVCTVDPMGDPGPSLDGLLGYEHAAVESLRDARNWCDSCLNGARKPPLRGIAHARFGDLITIFLCVFVVCLNLGNEAREIVTSQISAWSARANWIDNTDVDRPHTARVLSLIAYFRMFLVVPTTGYAVGSLVYYHPDAVTVCMDTIAVVFLLDIDNLILAHGLSARRRRRFEVDGKVHVENAEEDLVEFSRNTVTAFSMVMTWCVIFSQTELTVGAIAIYMLLILMRFDRYHASSFLPVNDGINKKLARATPTLVAKAFLKVMLLLMCTWLVAGFWYTVTWDGGGYWFKEGKLSTSRSGT